MYPNDQKPGMLLFTVGPFMKDTGLDPRKELVIIRVEENKLVLIIEVIKREKGKRQSASYPWFKVLYNDRVLVSSWINFEPVEK